MPDVLPAVDFEITYRGGDGYIRYEDGDLQVTAIVLRRAKYRPDLPWQIELVLAAHDSGTKFRAWHMAATLPDIVATEASGRTIKVSGFRWFESQANNVKGSSYDVSIGIEELPLDAEQVLITGYVTTNRSALPLTDMLLPHADGRRTGKRTRKPVRIRSKLGSISYWLAPITERVSIGASEGHAEINQALLQVRLVNSFRTGRITEGLRLFREQVAEFTALLSYLNRRQVGCSRITVSVQGKTPGARWFHEAELWQYAPEPLERVRHDEIVNAYRMEPDGLAVLFRNYLAQKHRELIKRSCVYLVGSYHQKYVETSVLYAYTAFEALVNGLEDYSRSLVLDDRVFSELRKHLERVIKAESHVLSISKQQRSALYAKLLELRRRPLIERAEEIMEHLSVEWQDLWPGVARLELALRAAYNRRSAFVHTGHMDDPGATLRDSIRIAVLAERIVYALLKGDPAWLSPLAYERYRHMPA